MIFLSALCQACVVVPESTDDILHDWKSHVNNARELAKKGNTKQAESEYAAANKALGSESDLIIYHALTLRELGHLYLSEKRNVDAKSSFIKAADLFQAQRKKDAEIYSIYARQHFDALYQLGLMELAAKQKVKAIEFFRQALWADTTNELAEKCKEQLLFLEGDVGMRPQISESVFKTVRGLAEISESHRLQTTSLLMLARKEQANGNVELALQYLNALYDLGKQRNDWACQAQLRFELIRHQYFCGNLDDARKLCDDALRLSSENEEYARLKFAYLICMFKIEDRLKHFQDADSFWKQAVELEKADKTGKLRGREIAILEQIAQLDVDTRHNVEAIRGFKRLFELIHSGPAIRPVIYSHYQSLYGTALLNNGDFEESRKIFLESLSPEMRKDDRYRSLTGLTSVYLAQHRPVEAKKCALEAKSLAVDSSGQVMVLMLLAKCAREAANSKEGLLLIDKALAESEKLKGTQSPQFIEAVKANCSVLKKQFEGR